MVKWGIIKDVREGKEMTVQILQGHDWEGLYIDGVLKLEGHSLDIQEVLRLVTGERVDETWVDDEEDWDKWNYRCPKTFPSYILDREVSL